MERAHRQRQHLGDLNLRMLDLNGHLLREVFDVLCDDRNYPLAFGCMTGKDRTGIVSALVLSVLGASHDDIMYDYMLSNASLRHNSEVNDMHMDASNTTSDQRQTESSKSGEKKDMVGAMVYKEIMQRTLKELDERGGSAKFLRSVVVTGLQLDSLRKVLVVPAAVASKM